MARTEQGGLRNQESHCPKTPRLLTIDHIVPLNRGGPDTLDNLAPAHRACNRAKSDGPTQRPGVTYITDRTW